MISSSGVDHFHQRYSVEKKIAQPKTPVGTLLAIKRPINQRYWLGLDAAADKQNHGIGDDLTVCRLVLWTLLDPKRTHSNLDSDLS